MNNIKLKLATFLKNEKVKKIKSTLFGNGYKDGIIVKIFIYLLLLLISFVFLYHTYNLFRGINNIVVKHLEA